MPETKMYSVFTKLSAVKGHFKENGKSNCENNSFVTEMRTLLTLEMKADFCDNLNLGLQS